MITCLPVIVNTQILEVSSPSFRYNGMIPEKHTCDGVNEPPDLIVKSIPVDTKSLAIIVDDPDAPVGTWVHWIVWNIRPESTINMDKITGRQGLNDFGMHKYCGPCPPNGMHHYHYKVYGLDTYLLDLGSNCTKYQLEKAMSTHIVACGELIGLYKRQ